MVSLALSCVWQHVKLSAVSLGNSPRYSLVVDEYVKKPTKPNPKPGTGMDCRFSNFFFFLVIQDLASLQIGLVR